MFQSIFYVAAIVLAFTNARAAIVKEDELHNHKLSDELHYTDFNGDTKLDHNAKYDHDAFLGKHEAEKFKAYTPEESKAALGIVDKIDKAKDGQVTEKELRNWIRFQQKLYKQRYADERWDKVNTDKDSFLEFDEMINSTIGGYDSWTEEEKESKKKDYKMYVKLMERDRKRFTAADMDGDGKLSKNEYLDFLHPETAKSMKDLVINETIEDLDLNSDGLVSLEEFIADLRKDMRPEEPEPEWLQREREVFQTYHDKNGDGALDREEVINWVMPADYDHTLNEAKHLIYEADENKDGKLSKKEILDNYGLFVASQATSYGQAIYDKEDL